MRGVYPIVDVDFIEARGVPLLDFAERVIEARPPLVQLRAKRSAPREVLELLRALAPRCHSAGVLLFANDRPDLAKMANCDGVHVGQDDLSIEDARSFAPDLRIGISTHDAKQLQAALDARPTYVAFGPVFATSTKERPDPVVGVSGLESAYEMTRQAAVPLVAIGGLSVDNIEAARLRCDLASVISATWPGEGLAGVTDRVRSLQRAMVAP